MGHGHQHVVQYLEKKGAVRGMMSDQPVLHLCKLAAHGDADGLRTLLRKCKVDINLGDYDKRTPIHLAASEGHLHIVKFLVDDLGADHSPIDRWGCTPLDDAV